MQRNLKQGETPEQSDKQTGLFIFRQVFERQKEGLTVETETPKVGLAEFTDVKEKFTEIAETTMTTHRTLTSKVGGENVTEVNRCSKRIQSENYERRVVVKHGRTQLQRRIEENRSPSQTQSQLAMYSSDPSAETERRLRRLQVLQDMNNEEFNRTVEDFIAKQKKQQREEID